MTKKEKIYVAALGVLFLIMILLEMSQPRPINWEHTYHKNDKIPYGNFLLYSLLKEDSYPNAVQDLEESYFEEEYQGKAFLNDESQHLLFIGDDYYPNEQDLQILFEYISGGGTAFLVSNRFPVEILDTLGFNVNADYFFEPEEEDETMTDLPEATVAFNFTNNSLRKEEGYLFRRNSVTFYIKPQDDKNQFEILAQNKEGKASFVTMPFGEGRFFIHCNPLIFTNYYMLTEDGSNYISAALSYLPAGTILWDQYQQSIQMEPTTPIRFVLQQLPLRWAWYLSLCLLAFWIIFQSKRRQRKIPIVAPPVNTSLEFVDTIGKLYYQQKKHHELARMKIRYFREMLQKKYFVKKGDNQEEVINKLEKQSQIDKVELKKMVEFVEVVELKEPVSEQELLILEKYTSKLANA